MTKALSPSTKRAGGTIRERAEEAARRQRMSLGDWLNAVVADEAAAAGVPVRDVPLENRQSAVITRLEALDRPALAPTPEPHGRPAAASDPEPTARERARRDGYRADRPRDVRRPHAFDTEDDRAWLRESLGGGRKRDGRPDRRGRHGDEPRRHDRPEARDERGRAAGFESAVEDMLAGLERRMARTQRQTDAALASVSDLLDSSENRHDAQRAAFADLAERLGEIEEHVTTRQGGEDGLKPIRGALARLETRLETLTRRNDALQPEAVAAELAAGNRVAQSLLSPGVRAEAAVGPEAIERLERKLNTILTAIGPRQLAADPTGAVRPEQTPLRAAIDAITRRQRSLDEPSHALVRPHAAAPAAGRDLDANLPMPGSAAGGDTPLLAGLGRDIRTLLAKVDDVRRDVADRATTGRAAEANARSLDALRLDMAGLASAVGELAPRRATTAIETAIATLADRMEVLRGEGALEAKLEPLGQGLDELRKALAANDPRPVIGALEREIRTVGTRLDDLGSTALDPEAMARIGAQTAEIHDLLSAAAARPVTLDKIERELASLSQRLETTGRPVASAAAPSADDLRTLVESALRSPVLQTIEHRLEQLATKVDAVAGTTTPDAALALSRRMDAIHADLSARLTREQPAAGGGADAETLARMVASLTDAVEAARRPGADGAMLGGLERQIARLAERLDRSEAEFAALSTLQASVGALFQQLEETRAATLDIAEQAARKAVGERPDPDAATHVAREIAEMRALQDAADRRTASTLSAVHDTLEKMVGRLAEMDRASPAAPFETAIAAERHLRATAPAMKADRRPAAPVLRDPLSDVDFLIEPGHGFPGRDEDAGAPAPLADGDGRADFIAAARRAARAAQRDADGVATQRPKAPSGVVAPAAAIAQAKAFFASRKRTVVLSLAALFVVAGTYAVVRTIGREDPAPKQVSIGPAPKAPGRVATRIEGQAPQASLSPTDRPATTAATLLPPSPPTMGVGPARPMAGADPIVAGTMATAAPVPTATPPSGALGVEMPRTVPSPKLRALADGGNAAAQYETANRYAEGRTFARDMKLAAQWYEKAAAGGFAPAQYRLGSLYEKGLGVMRDTANAKIWYGRAAAAGNARAMHNLAVLTAEGADGKPDYQGASAWFRRAADYGIRDSQYNLAILLARGLGVAQNLPQSYTWFAVAAAQGDADAGRKRDDVAARLSAADLAAARTAADAFHPRPLDSAANEPAPPAGGWDGPAPVAAERAGRPKMTSL